MLICIIQQTYVLCILAKHLPQATEKPDDYETFDFDDALESIFSGFLRSFKPSITKCCKIGEKVAKKGMTCSSSKHLNLDTLTWEEHAKELLGSDVEHDIPDSVVELLMKSQVCLLSDTYFGNFKKCCHYRQNYKAALSDCKKYKGKAKRRACKKQVHWQYP